MKSKRYLIYMVLAMVMASPMYAASERAEFDAQVRLTITKLNREAVVDQEAALRLAGLLQSEYGTSIEDMKWAVENSLTWGEIAAFAYIGTTTGRTFQEIGSAQAHRDLWDYTDKAGMNSEKMVHSLEQLLKRAEKERNSRIFERLRGSRRITRLPDLGSGFGLVQEALDFRNIDSPRPDKVHTVGPELAKGEK
jgi:hypothetical protein